MADCPLLYIEFRDPTVYSGWDDDFSTDTPDLCSAVGFLVFDDDVTVVLAAMYSPANDERFECNARLAIPATSITYISELTLGRHVR